MANRRLLVKKFHLKKHSQTVFMSAEDISQHADVSLATAHRWIKNGIPNQYLELLEFKILGMVPGMPGLFVRDGELHTPTGYKINQIELEQFAWNQTQYGSTLRELKRIKAENARLRHWLERKQPRTPPITNSRKEYYHRRRRA